MKDNGHCRIEGCAFDSTSLDYVVKTIPPATVQLLSYTLEEEDAEEQDAEEEDALAGP